MFHSDICLSVAASASGNIKKEKSLQKQTKTEEKAELKERICLNCGKPFLPKPWPSTGQKHCSEQCRDCASMRSWRARNAPLYLPKNCKMCGDEFVPNRIHQIFCHSECKITWYNNYSSYKPVSKEKLQRTPILEKEENINKEVKSTRKCSGVKCRNMCKIIRRYYYDKQARMVSWARGWSYDAESELLLCTLCQIQIKIMSEPAPR